MGARPDFSSASQRKLLMSGKRFEVRRISQVRRAVGMEVPDEMLEMWL